MSASTQSEIGTGQNTTAGQSETTKFKPDSYLEELVRPDPTFFRMKRDLEKPLTPKKTLEKTQSATKQAEQTQKKPARITAKAKPLGLPVTARKAPLDQPAMADERETRGKRLSRKELEALLDQFYETAAEILALLIVLSLLGLAKSFL